MHALSLGVTLLVLWLLLSGMMQPLLLAFGLGSAGVVLALALRMDVVDHEGHPVHLRWRRWFGYVVWLAAEIAKSSWDVARRIVDPRLPISPTVAYLETTQHSDLGRVIYANSITLTPGTVSIDVDGGGIRVHALTREGIEALRGGEMDRRVTALES